MPCGVGAAGQHEPSLASKILAQWCVSTANLFLLDGIASAGI